MENLKSLIVEHITQNPENVPIAVAILGIVLFVRLYVNAKRIY